MKRHIIIILYMLSTSIAGAQTEKVQNAPLWFFDPPRGEYAGVSPPLENQELAQSQAVYAALLSYVAQNEKGIAFEYAYNDYSEDFTDNDRYEELSNCRFTLPGNYQIVKTAINQYGEIFVSLQIMQGNDSINMFAHKYYLYTEKDESEQLEYSIEDKSQSNMVVNVYGKEYTLNNDTDSELQLERSSQRSSAKEIFVPDKSYFYPSKAKQMIERKGIIGIEMPWISYSMQHSLGIAYTAALLNSIIQDCKTVSQAIIMTGIVSEINDEINNAPNNAYTANSETKNMVVTKPARVLTARIDREWFSLLNKK